MALKNIFLIIFVVAMGLRLNADDSEAKFNIVKGQPYQMNFGDGRIAVVKAVSDGVSTLRLNATIQESECFPKAKRVSCVYPKLVFQFMTLSIVWLKHPEPSRVGQTVMLSSAENSNAGTPQGFGSISIEDYYLYKGEEQTNPNIAPILLQCPDFSWLHGKSDAPSMISVPVIATTSMDKNSETEESMNQLSDGVRDVVWKSLDSKTLQIQSIDRNAGFRLTDSTSTLLAGLDSLWVLEKEDGDLCQIRIALSIADNQSSGASHFYPTVGDAVSIDKAIQRSIIRPYYKIIQSLNKPVVQ